ncbi:MAG: hypothetical protein FJ134_09740 [Deltaproteobacteria bacterium]|nr:hypothetical protein [Deltaproteobacteria bacterium]
MNIRKIITIFLVLFFLLTIEGFGQDKPGGKFKSGSEPEGFRGIKWGTHISALSDMKCVQHNMKYDEHESKGSCDFYYKIEDKLKLGDANLTSIKYGFNEKGDFEFIEIEMEGKDNFNRIMNTFFGIFGPVNPIDQSYHYVWRGSKTIILVTYYDYTYDKNTTVSMWSSKSEAERERKEQEKEKRKLKEAQDKLKEAQKEFK